MPQGTDEPIPETPSIGTADSVTRGFLFSDLRGYTAFVEQRGATAAAELLGRYRNLVRREVARYRGAEIKTEGDSFYVVFPSVTAAVNAGLAILDSASAENVIQPDRAIQIGIGVHAGETVETSEGYVGAPVNIAARLCAQAKADELLVTDTVRALTSSMVRQDFVPLGRRRLKGIAEPVAIFAVRTTRATKTPRNALPHSAGRRAAFATAAFVVIVAIAGVGAFAALRPQASTSDSPAVSSPLATPSEQGSGLTALQQKLLASVPSAVVDFCKPAAAEAAARSAASFRCDLPLGTDADTTWWDIYVAKGELTLTFDQLAAARRVPDGTCTLESPVGKGAWSLGVTFSGGVLCYADAGHAWIVWTYSDERVLARATRLDGDWPKLFAWWRQNSALFRTAFVPIIRLG